MGKTNQQSAPLAVVKDQKHNVQRSSPVIRAILILLLLEGALNACNQHGNNNPYSFLLHSSSAFFSNVPISTSVPVLAIAIPDDVSRIALMTRNAKAKGRSIADFGMVVAHCKEDEMKWVQDDIENIVISDKTFNQQHKATWNATVYERCGKKVHPEYSKFQMNVGSEECSAYIKYIIDGYNDLPEVIYFLQPDAFLDNHWKNSEKHTNFNSLQELLDGSAPLLMSHLGGPTANKTNASSTLGFLQLGTRMIQEYVSTPNAAFYDPSEVVDMLKERRPSYNNETRLSFAPGACFAVRRERIWANPIDFYRELQLSIYHHEDVRRMCWNLERTWHVVFGEPLLLPLESTVLAKK